MQEDTAVSATTAPRPRKKIAIDDNQRIVIKGAREHNLKNVDRAFGVGQIEPGV